MFPSSNDRFIFKHRLGFLIFLAAIQMPLARAETWVITDLNHPAQTPAHARLLLLDETETLEAKLSEGLPADPQQAIAIIQKRLSTNDAQRLQRDLAQAQQNLVDAWSVGVTKIPAVVVDRKFVVYGETDVIAAEHRIAQWRADAKDREEPDQGVAQ